MTVKILVRQGTAQEWTDANPILGSGEPGYETDTKYIKIGNGVTAWNSLPYYHTGMIPWDSVTNKPVSFIPVYHTHNPYEVGLTNVTNHAQLKRVGADFDEYTQKSILSDNDIFLIEDSEAAWIKKKVAVSTIRHQSDIRWSIQGPLTVSTLMRMDIRSNCIIKEVYSAIRITPLGSAVQIQLYKVSSPNATPVLSDSVFLSDIPNSINPTEHSAIGILDPSAITCVPGNVLILAIVQVGSSIAGSDLTTVISFR
jgi:hypothetical protein